MMSVGPTAWLAPLLLVLASGCAGGESSTAARSADHDSAGTRIIDAGPIPDDLGRRSDELGVQHVVPLQIGQPDVAPG
jgi:hypothetical protein